MLKGPSCKEFDPNLHSFDSTGSVQENPYCFLVGAYMLDNPSNNTDCQRYKYFDEGSQTLFLTFYFFLLSMHNLPP